MRIVITGGNGYIGARLSLYLAGKGNDVIPVCFPNIPQNKSWTKQMYSVLSGDIRLAETISKIAKLKPDILIHLVSLDQVESEKEVGLANNINLLPTWKLLDACTKNGLKKFIYFSTIHVYGKNLNGVVKEEQKPTPYNIYGLTHFLSEEVCNYYHRKTNTECINIRLSNSYGEPVFSDANCWSLIVNDLAKTAFNFKKIVLKGDGKAVRDFIHFSDIGEGVNKLISSTVNSSNNTIHFSSSIVVSMLEVAMIVRMIYFKRYNETIPVYINGNELFDEKAPVVRRSYVISNEIAKSYNIYFEKNLEEGIEDLFVYLEKNNA